VTTLKSTDIELTDTQAALLTAMYLNSLPSTKHLGSTILELIGSLITLCGMDVRPDVACMDVKALIDGGLARYSGTRGQDEPGGPMQGEYACTGEGVGWLRDNQSEVPAIVRDALARLQDTERANRELDEIPSKHYAQVEAINDAAVKLGLSAFTGSTLALLEANYANHLQVYKDTLQAAIDNFQQELKVVEAEGRPSKGGSASRHSNTLIHLRAKLTVMADFIPRKAKEF
jgi:hypothetical protein